MDVRAAAGATACLGLTRVRLAVGIDLIAGKAARSLSPSSSLRGSALNKLLTAAITFWRGGAGGSPVSVLAAARTAPSRDRAAARSKLMSSMWAGWRAGRRWAHGGSCAPSGWPAVLDGDIAPQLLDKVDLCSVTCIL